MKPECLVRPYQPGDEAGITKVWYETGKETYHFLESWQCFSREDALSVITKVVLPNSRVWVGLAGETVVAFMSLKGTVLDRLYVLPDFQGQGWGGEFIRIAKQQSPDRLELYTHQENRAARTFYELHGFRPTAFGISPPPESAPDVKYLWVDDG